MGTPKPCLRLVKISAGNRSAATIFSRYFNTPLRVRMVEGRDATYSTMYWSSKGARVSSELNMLALSTLTRISSVRYLRASTYCCCAVVSRSATARNSLMSRSYGLWSHTWAKYSGLYIEERESEGKSIPDRRNREGR